MPGKVVHLFSQGPKGQRRFESRTDTLPLPLEEWRAGCLPLSCMQSVEYILGCIRACSEFNTEAAGLIVNGRGLIEDALLHFVAQAQRGKRIRPSESLAIEASAITNHLAVRFRLTGLVESLFLPFRHTLLQQRAEIALQCRTLEDLYVLDLYHPDSEEEAFELTLYRRTQPLIDHPSRIGIAALGVVSPYGSGLKTLTEGLCSGQRATAAPHSPASVFLQRSWLKNALEEALEQTHLNKQAISAGDTAILVVTRAGPLPVSSYTDAVQQWLGDRADWFADMTSLHQTPLSISAACASVFFAIRLAQDLLHSQHYQRALIIGVDAINTFETRGLQALQALSKARAKPFDLKRDGIHLGEGAGVLILETCSKLSERHQRPLAWIEACSTFVAFPKQPITCPDAILYTMQACLAHTEDPVDALQAHATGTVKGDLIEADAIRRLFAPKIPPPVFSIKGALGHALYISGFHALAASLISLHKQALMPTVGCEHIDPAIGLCIAQKKPEPLKINTLLANSLGFSGNYSSLLLKRSEAIGHGLS